jgi:hypothetical protein
MFNGTGDHSVKEDKMVERIEALLETKKCDALKAKRHRW